MESVIRTIMSSLEYDVIFRKSRIPSHNFLDKCQCHLICHCPEDELFWSLDVLHELIHAGHYESMPIEFSVNPRVVPISLRCDDEVNCYFNTARDWFVTGRMIELCPDDTRDQIRHSKETIKKKYSSRVSMEDKLIAGLLCAETEYFLKQQRDQTAYDQDVYNICDILLSMSSSEPSVENLFVMVDRLLDVFGYFKLETLVESKEKIVRQIKPIDWHKDPANLKRLFDAFKGSNS